MKLLSQDHRCTYDHQNSELYPWLQFLANLTTIKSRPVFSISNSLQEDCRNLRSLQRSIAAVFHQRNSNRFRLAKNSYSRLSRVNSCWALKLTLLALITIQNNIIFLGKIIKLQMIIKTFRSNHNFLLNKRIITNEQHLLRKGAQDNNLITLSS